MKNYILFISLFVTTMVSAQSFTKHQWKNRLIIVVDKTETQEKFQTQLSLFQGKLAELEDRKLLIYQYSAHQVKLGLEESNDWKQEALPTFLKRKCGQLLLFLYF